MGKIYKARTFVSCYDEWMKLYKVGFIADITLEKYKNALKFLVDNFGEISIGQLDRRMYQIILNKYAENHEKQTVQDFHHQVKACIKDLYHDGKIELDPTYKAVIKGCQPRKKKRMKYLQVEELKALVRTLNLGNDINKDWLILIMIKTGVRFAEALAITPNDFNFASGTLTINKTWNYKDSQNPRFMPTKTIGSVRTIDIDWQIVGRFAPVIKDLPQDEPIFIEKNKDGGYKRIFNSTIGQFLLNKCEQAGITKVTLHALRHTHASVLLSAGSSIFSISKRLGHSNISTTQETYAHILDELRAKDNQIMMQTLMSI
jgi:Site-specific recombinase XerD